MRNSYETYPERTAEVPIIVRAKKIRASKRAIKTRFAAAVAAVAILALIITVIALVVIYGQDKGPHVASIIISAT